MATLLHSSLQPIPSRCDRWRQFSERASERVLTQQIRQAARQPVYFGGSTAPDARLLVHEHSAHVEAFEIFSLCLLPSYKAGCIWDRVCRCWIRSSAAASSTVCLTAGSGLRRGTSGGEQLCFAVRGIQRASERRVPDAPVVPGARTVL